MSTENAKIFYFISLSILVFFLLTACIPIQASIKAKPVSRSSSTLVLSVRGIAENVRIGGVDISLTIPQGVSVKAQKNGLLESGVISSANGSSLPFLSGRFSDNLLRIAMIASSGFTEGDLLLINVDGDPEVLHPENFPVQSFQLVNLKGATITNAKVLVSEIR